MNPRLAGERKLVSLVILSLVTNTVPFGQVMAQQTVQNKDELRHTQKIKKVVSETGASLDREVTVKLKDKTEVRGVISEIADDHFIIKLNSGAPYPIDYSQVKKFTASKVNLAGKSVNGPSGFKTLIAGVAIGLGVIVTTCLVSRRCAE